MTKLRTALATYGHTKAIKDGSLSPAGYELEFEEFTPQSQAFRAMVPEPRLDLVEMVMWHYLMARDAGYPFIGVPVFPVRQFHHSAITVNQSAGVKTPKDLEGKRVGIRTYGFSRSFWLRGAFDEQYGVDNKKVTWVVEESEALPDFKLPANVEVARGADLGKMLESGELAGGIGVATKSEDVKPLIADSGKVEADWFKSTGVYPISHLLVLRKEVADADPALAAAVFQTFKDAKARFMAEIESGAELSAGDKANAGQRAVVGADPLPYGVAANRPTLEMAVRQAHAQGFTSSAFSVEELFVPSTLSLT